MKIELVIGLDTLGDANTREDNERYAAAVEAAIIEKFPDADVSVELGAHSSCYASDDDVAEVVKEIKARVWDSANY